MRRCANLRALLSASVTLLTSSFTRTAATLAKFVNEGVLNQMYQVYNIDTILPAEPTEIPSLGDLKAACLAMHESRRYVCCILLSLHMEKQDASWQILRDIISEIGSLTRLLAESTVQLQKALEDKDCIPLIFQIPDGSVQLARSARGERPG